MGQKQVGIKVTCLRWIYLVGVKDIKGCEYFGVVQIGLMKAY